jgi:hypothetical protein
LGPPLPVCLINGHQETDPIRPFSPEAELGGRARWSPVYYRLLNRPIFT